jgi:hypothetical protein
VHEDRRDDDVAGAKSLGAHSLDKVEEVLTTPPLSWAPSHAAGDDAPAAAPAAQCPIERIEPVAFPSFDLWR